MSHLIAFLSVGSINFVTVVGEDKIHHWYETDSELDAIGFWKEATGCAELVPVIIADVIWSSDSSKSREE